MTTSDLIVSDNWVENPHFQPLNSTPLIFVTSFFLFDVGTCCCVPLTEVSRWQWLITQYLIKPDPNSYYADWNKQTKVRSVKAEWLMMPPIVLLFILMSPCLLQPVKALWYNAWCQSALHPAHFGQPKLFFSPLLLSLGWEMYNGGQGGYLLSCWPI